MNGSLPDRLRGASGGRRSLCRAAAACGLWTLILGASLVWNIRLVHRTALDLARTEARATYEKDLVYRRWNAGLGGVYAVVTPQNRPNAYLAGVPNRDVVTSSGLRLTLVNPAYMTRQVHELAAAQYGVRGHITSLRPLRPENAPDPWETAALRTFEAGRTEASSVETEGGHAVLRLMRPLRTEARCLPCHASQGYRVGDLRGGISVSVPLATYRALALAQVRRLSLAHGVIWLLGLAAAGLGLQRLQQRSLERDRAQQALRELNAELESRVAERTAELESFSHSISHDLRSPLRHIDGYSQVLLEDLGPSLDGENACHLRRLRAASQHLSHIVDDLLRLSRVSRGELLPEPVDLSALAEGVLRSLREEAPDRVLEAEVQGGLEAVGDPRLLRVLLENLLGNAWKYTARRSGAHLAFGEARAGGERAYFVRDNGVGFDMAYAGKLFQPFQRLHSAEEFGGTGIGLATAQRIVRRHGGRIWAEGTVGRGAAFYFTLSTTRSPAQPKEGVVAQGQGTTRSPAQP